ncbi:unnamed protein product [Rhodiola kirilowii]
MPRTRGKTPGWAAVDLQLRHGGVLGSELESDPYPPIQNTIAPLPPSKNTARSHNVPIMPLSSFVMPPPAGVALETATKEIERALPAGGKRSSKNYKGVIVSENVQKLSLEKLVERYCLADRSLIEDILLAVDNDFSSANRILEEMYPSKSFIRQNKSSIRETSSSMKDFGHGKCILESGIELRSNTVPEHSQMSYSFNDGLAENSKGLDDGFEYSAEQLCDDAVESIKNSLEHLKFIPMEPEWEEDDVYLSHRKDAIKLMRSAAQHSRMASSSFLKGDHYSAQQHSSRARDDWLAANNLHSKAAKEILSINNNKNDMWKLDLHGLHAAEAVIALQNRLTMIETQSSPHRSISPKRVTGTCIMAGSSSSESLSCMIKDSGSGASVRDRPKTLEVITGRGLHSKGHAALPAAVRGFLDENGYRYDQTRPGVITVCPKFRRARYVPK